MSILVCVPYMKPHRKFLPHFIEWYAANKEKHDLLLHWEMWRPLHQVQSNAVKQALEMKCSHILFTEDDQWGFPVDGLEVLLEADKDIIGFPSYSKVHPYLPMTYRKADKSIPMTLRKRNLIPMYSTEEIEEFDLITWAFTLVRTSVFPRLGVDPFLAWDSVPTDSHFCQACEDAGIPRFIHKGITINHGEVGANDISFHRRMYDSMFASRGIYGKDAIVVPEAHDDIVYRPEFQQAIFIANPELMRTSTVDEGELAPVEVPG